FIEGHEKYHELQYFQALMHFFLNDLTTCKKAINNLLNTEIRTNNRMLYRATRLLFILIAYENEDSDFLDYEIRSYRRIFNKVGRDFKIENLIFKMILSDDRRSGNGWKAREREVIKMDLARILSDRPQMSPHKLTT